MPSRQKETPSPSAFDLPASAAGAVPGAAAATAAALESLTDDRAFERAVISVLQAVDRTIRHTGGPGDQARDGAGGPWSAASDEVLVMVSLEARWKQKIRRELVRIAEFGHTPATILAVTNRRASASELRQLEKETQGFRYRVTVLDQAWLVNAFLRMEHLPLRESFLRLAPPSFSVLTTTAEQHETMRDALGGATTPFTGRRRTVAKAVDVLNTGRSLVLEGPGGVGKTRLALEIARRSGADEVQVLRASTRIDFSRLPSEVVGEGRLVLIIDDAHRRTELAETVDIVTRRRGPVQLILTSRPGYRQELYAATHDSGIRFDEHYVRKLSGKAIARLIDRTEPPLEFDRVRDGIVRVADGNPFIALVARKVVAEGGAIRDLGADGALLAHTHELLATIAGTSTANVRQLYDVAALVSAAGRVVASNGEASAVLAGILGVAQSDLRHWLADLADGGLLTGTGDPAAPFAFSADVLSEIVMRDGFLGDHPRSRTRYADVWPAVATLDAEAAAKAIAGATTRAIDPADPAFAIIRNWCLERVDDDPDLVLGVVREAAPGVPTLAEEMIREVLRYDRRGEAIGLRTLRSSAELLSRRHPTFDTSWELLLEVARLIFAADPPAELATATHDDVANVYRRLPVGSGPTDGAILASVQEAMVDIAKRFWVRHCPDGAASPGAAAVVAAAASTLLTLTFDDTYAAPGDERTIFFGQRTLPASRYTKSALEAGADLVAEVLPHLDPADAAATVRRLKELVAGAHGNARRLDSLPDDLVEVASATVKSIASGLAPMADRFPVPLRHLVNDTFGQLVFPGPEVAEFAAVLAVDHERYVRSEVEEAERVGSVIRSHLLSGDPSAAIKRWERWVQDANNSGIEIAPLYVSEVLVRAATADAPAMAPVIDDLGRRGSILLRHASAALAQILKSHGDEERARRWESRGAGCRQVLAFALSRLTDERWAPALTRLASDADPDVRTAAARVANYAGSQARWAQDIALAACSDGDAGRLYFVLLSLDALPGRTSPAKLDSEVVAEVTRLVTSSGGAFPRADRHVTEVLQIAEELVPGSLMRWVWTRVDAACASGDRYPSQDRWDFPYRLLESFEFASTDDDRLRALALLEDEPTMGSTLATDVLKAIDHGSPVITDWIAAKLSSANRVDWRVARSLLDNPMSWSAYRDRARTIAERNSSADTVAGIVYARTPSGWVGSRRPGIEETLAEFRSWDEPILAPVRKRAEAVLGATLSEIDRDESADDPDDDDPEPLA